MSRLFRFLDFGSWNGPKASGAVVALIALLVSAVAGAVNVNESGASVNLVTTDLSSGSAQGNSAGARLVSAGTPVTGVVSTNGAGAKVIIEPMNAIAGKSAPTVDFSGGPLTGEAPLAVQFTDASSGGLYEITSWSWDFGDGTAGSSEQNPKHTYETPGSYSVTLTTTTAGGSPTVTKNNYVVVAQGLPAAGFFGLLTLIVGLSVAGAALWRRRACEIR